MEENVSEQKKFTFNLTQPKDRLKVNGIFYNKALYYKRDMYRHYRNEIYKI